MGGKIFDFLRTTIFFEIRRWGPGGRSIVLTKTHATPTQLSARGTQWGVPPGGARRGGAGPGSAESVFATTGTPKNYFQSDSVRTIP